MANISIEHAISNIEVDRVERGYAHLRLSGAFRHYKFCCLSESSERVEQLERIYVFSQDEVRRLIDCMESWREEGRFGEKIEAIVYSKHAATIPYHRQDLFDIPQRESDLPAGSRSAGIIVAREFGGTFIYFNESNCRISDKEFFDSVRYVTSEEAEELIEKLRSCLDKMEVK